MVSNKIVFPGEVFSVSTQLSTIIKYYEFTLLQTDTVLWTPAAGKSIYLTAIDISAGGAFNVSLERASNDVFFKVQFSTFLTPYTQSFTSPVKFNIDQSIYLSTNAAAAGGNVTLYGYEM